jgi:hypothetical protein
MEKKQIQVKPKEDKENRLIKIFLISTAVIIILVAAAYFFVNSLRHTNYKGVDFETIQFDKLILYHTTIPVMYQGEETDYNFYFRTNPNKLKGIPFEGEDNFKLMKYSVLKLEDEFSCDGYEVIAIQNVANLNEQMQISFLMDENATCDSRYNLFILKKADKTEIVELSENCYEVRIANCEILPGTEKVMAEMFAKFKSLA